MSADFTHGQVDELLAVDGKRPAISESWCAHGIARHALHVDGRADYEQTPFRPPSPYAVGKSTAYWLVANYRDACGLHPSTGILFNHESSLRAERFVTKEIVAATVRIARAERSRLSFGTVHVKRDRGWAPENVDAIWRVLQQSSGSDFVIATGESHTLQEFAKSMFGRDEFNWQEHTDVSEPLRRPSDFAKGRGYASRAREVLGSPSYRMSEVIGAILEAEPTGVQYR